MSRILYGLSTSPWTERARWALDHHGLSYRYHEHVPMLGELFLRRKARLAPGQRATVPLLVDGDESVMGSTPIARHADRVSDRGESAPLCPKGEELAIDRWSEHAERILQIARTWIFGRLMSSRAAQAESLPPFIPSPLRAVLAPTTGLAVKFLGNKYDAHVGEANEVDRALRPLFEEVRRGLGSGRTLVGSGFSLADIAIASTVQVLRPHERSKLGPAVREAWSHEGLARDFTDVIAWRDSLYTDHRGESARIRAA